MRPTRGGCGERSWKNDGFGAIADLGFVGLDDSGPDAKPAVITGYKAARNRPLTRGRKQSSTALTAVRAPVEHGFAT
ncbi:hypothetical protein [Streptomyces sp. CBMA152]|uniref:hypothetical protein n=1 Tax=Streptomyces sp. CBMA152 TaxID=1896312 RepID=UPI00166185B9|nr:hypothetical protein [Streptomyces sp. CBMA152]